MKKIVGILIWFLVFTIPLNEWSSETLVDLLGIGTINRWAGFLATLGFVFGMLIRQNLRPLSGPQVMLVLFGAWAVFSFTWSDYPVESGAYVFTLLSNVVLVLIFSQFVSTDKEISPLYLAYLAGALFTGLALIEYKLFFSTTLSQGSIEYSAGRLTVFGNNENELAQTFSLGVPLAWYVSVKRQKSWHRLVGWVFIPVAAAGVFLTGSRGGLLGLSLAILVIVIVPLFTEQRKKSLTFTVVLLLIFASQAGRFTEFSETTLARMEVAVEGSADSYSEADIRTSVWRAGLETYFSHTEILLNGCGIGAFVQFVPPTRGKRFVSHNAFIAIIVELGIIGISIFLFLVASFIYSLKYLDGIERTLWFGVFLAWVVLSMFGNTEYGKNTWLFFGLYASRVAYMANLHIKAKRQADRTRLMIQARRAQAK